jgi:FlaA1/EpsC-like NDP-sugar epimerase
MVDVFNKYHPEMVIHAAAHKHVPLMEDNPTEALKNNVIGTKYVADISHLAKVDKFVFISTDKAVNPTSIMGVTKRIAEIYIKNLQSNTHFSIVRFGNVMNSEGSVMKIFKRKAELGQSIPVTHPEIQRYFMSIPEASKLVIDAINMGSNGDVYVLDMGEQRKILDIAKEYAKKYGVGIYFTGLRKGEKLYEELLYENETLEKTDNPKIRKCTGEFAKVNFNEYLKDILLITDKTELENRFRSIVPEYKRCH